MKNNVCKISLISLVLACSASMPGWAAVKMNNSNRSYAAGYQQVNAMRYQQEYMNQIASNATTASATGDLPVMVEDENLARAILNNTSTETNISQLEACSMIYPTGVFRWGVPESGIRQNQDSQCVAVVNLIDANTNTVLATTTLAAGDTMKCNIDYFPESGFNVSALQRPGFELPADAAPTEEDVRAVMDAEQKQNAGLKIAAGAIIAGVAGNLLAPKDAGAKEGKIPLGTGKTQLKDTVIGAAAGAGIMAASTYSGKIAGDTIKSTAVNAASGMIVGNMLAGANSGDSILATTKCTVDGIERDCIIGNVAKVVDSINNKMEDVCGSKDYEFLIMTENAGNIKCCKPELDSSPIEFKCDDAKSVSSLVNIQLERVSGTVSYEKFKSDSTIKSNSDNPLKVYTLQKDKTFEETNFSNSGGEGDIRYYRIASANLAGRKEPAYAVINGSLTKKAFGYKISEWESTLKNQSVLYRRGYGGNVGEEFEISETNKYQFIPSSRDADDGGLVDLSNESRAKGTIVGTAAGGALGGFAGYQGAKNEMTERLLAAQREYEGSLTNFVCYTGDRFLSIYNSYVEIPELNSDN